MTLKRIFAYLIDIFIVSILVNLILYLPFLKNTQERYLETSNEYFEEIFNSTSGSSDLTEEELIKTVYNFQKDTQAINILTVGVSFIYFGVIAFICNGQTLGKKILKIKVAPVKGDKLNPQLFILRAIIICNIIPRIAIIIITNYGGMTTWYTLYNIINNLQNVINFVIIGFIIFRDDERGLHDLICNTKVIDLKE